MKHEMVFVGNNFNQTHLRGFVTHLATQEGLAILKPDGMQAVRVALSDLMSVENFNRLQKLEAVENAANKVMSPPVKMPWEDESHAGGFSCEQSRLAVLSKALADAKPKTIEQLKKEHVKALGSLTNYAHSHGSAGTHLVEELEKATTALDKAKEARG